MPNLRRLLARKWMPALLYGSVGEEDLGSGAVRPEHLDRPYIESTIGSESEGVTRKILRLWVQDGRVFGESTDEF